MRAYRILRLLLATGGAVVFVVLVVAGYWVYQQIRSGADLAHEAELATID